MARERRSRRGRGEGSIRERDNGTYEARVSLGYDVHGKRKSRSVYGKTKAEVQEKLRGLQDAAGKGSLVEPSKLTVREYLSAWYAEVVKPQSSPTTYERYESIIRLHINPHIGGMRLAALTPLHVQRLNSQIADSIMTPGTRAKSPHWTQRMAVTLLHNAFAHAVKTRLMPTNPATDIPKAKPTEREMSTLTAQQVRTFLAAAQPRRLYALFALAVGSGMREGELLALAWDAIDFAAGTVSVRRNLVQFSKKTAGERFGLKEPKSKRSKRTLKVPAFVLTALREHRTAMVKEGHGSPYVFTTKTGVFIGKSNLTRQVFRPILDAANLPRIRIHDLRHTHASALLNSGASIKAVSQRLGHSSVELTLRTYTHLLPDADDTLAGLSDVLFA